MLRFFIRLLLLLIALLGLLVIFAPNLISTNWGKSVFFKTYQALTGKIVSADTFDISWWKGQKFENLFVKYPKDKMTFMGQKITTDATLWQLVFFNDLGNMEMTSPEVVMNADFPMPVQKRISQAGFVPILGHIPSTSMPSYLGHVIVKNGKAKFLTKGFDPIQLQNVEMDISLLKTQIKVKGSGETLQKNIGGNFNLSLLYNQSQIDLTANLQNFPMRSIDQTVALFQPVLKEVLVEAVGEAVNVQFKLKNTPLTLELFCDATSPSFSAHIETKSQNGTVTLANPALIQFQIPKSLIHQLTTLPIRDAFKAQLRIDNFSLSLANREKFSFQATLKGEALEFPFGTIQPLALFVSTSDFSKRNFILKLDSQDVRLDTSLHLPDDWQMLTFTGEGLFPGNTKIDFSAQTLSTIIANIQGDQWQATLAGGYDIRQSVVFLNQPASVVYHLAQLPAPWPPLLQQPLTIHGQIKPLRISLAELSGPISFQLKTDPTSLGEISIGETTLSATADLKTKKGTFTLSSSLGKGTVNASGIFVYPKEIAAKATLVQTPTALLDLFLKETVQLTPIIGPEFNATLNLKSEQEFSFDLSSNVLTAQVFLEQKNGSINLTKPAKVSFTLTPEGYLALDQGLNKTSSPFILTEPIEIKSTITSFSLPRKDKITSAEITCQADLSIDKLAFAGKESKKGTQLRNMKLHLEHAAETPFSFNLSTSGSPAGTLSVQGTTDLTGNLQFSSKLDQFPTEALDVVARIIGQSQLSYAALFGPQVNITASSSLNAWNGPLKLELRSPNIQASLDGLVSQKMLTLKDTFYMQLSLTPDLSRLILSQLNPLSLSAISSEAPITFQIPAQGFSYPLLPNSDAKINIPSGRLELGKIYCHNEGNVNIALGLLKLSQFSQNEKLELWFAPLDFHIVNGLLDCERTETLIANTYQICSFGTIDFVAREVDMVLGLTASCLQKAFGINNLPDNYVLQIPMRGPFDNVKINTSKATAKIAALLLWQKKNLSKAFGNSSAGAILGEFMNKLGPLPDGDSKAPPSKKPFPWDSPAKPSSKKKKTSEAPKNKKHFTPDEQALKQVLKMFH